MLCAARPVRTPARRPRRPLGTRQCHAGPRVHADLDDARLSRRWRRYRRSPQSHALGADRRDRQADDRQRRADGARHRARKAGPEEHADSRQGRDRQHHLQGEEQRYLLLLAARSSRCRHGGPPRGHRHGADRGAGHGARGQRPSARSRLRIGDARQLDGHGRRLPGRAGRWLARRRRRQDQRGPRPLRHVLGEQRRRRQRAKRHADVGALQGDAALCELLRVGRGIPEHARRGRDRRRQEDDLHHYRLRPRTAAPGRCRPAAVRGTGHLRADRRRRDRRVDGDLHPRESLGAHQFRSLPVLRDAAVLPERDDPIGRPAHAGDGSRDAPGTVWRPMRRGR